MTKGKITQIIGPVIDVEFPEDQMPALYNALEIAAEGDEKKKVFEVAKHLEPGRVRAVGLTSTDGLARGTEVTDTGKPISVPVGSEVLGKIFNVFGDTLNEGANKTTFKKHWPIHRPAPTLEQQSTKVEL